MQEMRQNSENIYPDGPVAVHHGGVEAWEVWSGEVSRQVGQEASTRVG